MSKETIDGFLTRNGALREVVDESPLMLLVLDAESGCVLSSRARLVFLGRTARQEQGEGWLETVHPDDRDALSLALREAIANQRSVAVDHRAIDCTGECHAVSTRAIPWFAPGHEYLGHVAISSEIGDTRNAGREQPRQLRRLIENSHDMVYRARLVPSHMVEYCGGATLAITGHTSAEFYADPELITRCVHPDDHPLLAQNVISDPENAQLPVIMRWIHPDGRVVYAEHRRVPVYNNDGQIIAVEGIARDVTEFVEGQRRLRESEDQLRQLAARLHAARELERAQVARELHDELGQTLTALKLDISRMVQAFTREQLTPPLVDRLQSLIGLSDIGLATVKRIATRLRPPTLDHLGLAEAIHWEAMMFKARTGLRCTVRANKSRTSLSSEHQTELFRIFQEALTNVVRHAQASAVQVTLTERGRRFEMKIRDNGCGITEAQSADPSAIGLLGMRERTALMGGLFQISGRRGKGTIVSIEVPVSHSKQARAGLKPKLKVAQ